MMEDLRKVNYKKYNKNTDWVNRGFYTGVIPILEQPGQSRDDIHGAGFLIDYEDATYVVTAKHVVDIDNPVLLLTGTNRADIFIQTEYFTKQGINWIYHKTEDLAVLPFKIPEGFKRIINTRINPNQTQVNLKLNQTVKHLGYPDGMTGTWSDTKEPNNISSGATGKILQVSPNKIIIGTPAHHGDSGGPLLLKIGNQAKLIGVITETKVLRKISNPNDGVYLGKTTAIPFNLFYDIFNS